MEEVVIGTYIIKVRQKTFYLWMDESYYNL